MGLELIALCPLESLYDFTTGELGYNACYSFSL